MLLLHGAQGGNHRLNWCLNILISLPADWEIKNGASSIPVVGCGIGGIVC